MGRVHPKTHLLEPELGSLQDINLDRSRMDRSFNGKRNRINAALADKLRADFQRLKRYFNLDDNITPKAFKQSAVYKGKSS